MLTGKDRSVLWDSCGERLCGGAQPDAGELGLAGGITQVCGALDLFHLQKNLKFFLIENITSIFRKVLFGYRYILCQFDVTVPFFRKSQNVSPTLSFLIFKLSHILLLL